MIINIFKMQVCGGKLYLLVFKRVPLGKKVQQDFLLAGNSEKNLRCKVLFSIKVSLVVRSGCSGYLFK